MTEVERFTRALGLICTIEAHHEALDGLKTEIENRVGDADERRARIERAHEILAQVERFHEEFAAL
jgi:hypothetical protein